MAGCITPHPPNEQGLSPALTAPLALQDIQNHYWPNATPVDRARYLLNSTASDPDRLAFIMLFWNANPRWKTHKALFAKTKVNILPGYLPPYQFEDADTQTSLPAIKPIPSVVHVPAGPQRPIAVYERVSRRGPFAFAGWHTVERVEFLRPRSKALLRMLEQKWALEDRKEDRKVERGSKVWNRSVGVEWAVVQLAVCRDAGPPPTIPHREPEDREGPRVTLPGLWSVKVPGLSVAALRSGERVSVSLAALRARSANAGATDE
ncbi:hypothetical protein EJ06DRAFT_525955 [Trichodelitschia bisporula]|uniref:Uncharacterized protein n=1 Tax=Trichodelitschia bisporula TaxID=703511 RepID=A0A6G1IAZ2_9PEZI|nr:hypothetical protein EJ06DRAFT_525955 [Trichodelitschia bisporula]